MANCFMLEIVTPERCVYKGEAVQISLTGSLGAMTLLAHHAPMVSDLVGGTLRFILPDGGEREMEISGGFVEVSENQVSVLDG